MSISTTDVLAYCDSLSKSLLDIQTTFVTNPATVAPTAATIIAGMATASPSTLNRIAGFNNAQEQLALLAGTNTTAGRVAAQLAAATQIAAWYPYYAPSCDALESLTSGLATYLASNSLVVSGLFAAAFNYYASTAAGLGYRSASYVVTRIAAANTFVPVDTVLATELVGGGTPFTPLTTLDNAVYLSAPIAIVVYPSGVPGSPPGSPVAEAQTITYIPTTGASPLTVVITPTVACVTPGTFVTTGISGVAVTGVSLGTAANDTGYTYSYVARPTRLITTY